jgi:hypothetical protein
MEYEQNWTECSQEYTMYDPIGEGNMSNDDELQCSVESIFIDV